MPRERKKEKVTTDSAQETVNRGQQIAKQLKPGDVIYLYGDLGSGKTVFVKGVCQGLGVEESVTSSSFVIVTEYKGNVPVAHIDLYRLSESEVANLPIEEYLLPDGITIIEWADRLTATDGMRIRFTIIGANTRELVIEDLRH